MSSRRTVDLELPRYLPVPTLTVEVVAGPDVGAVLSEPRESVTVGVAAGNAVVLTDPSVSGYHLELTGRPDGILVWDCGSTNGTRVGDVTIERVVVVPGTVLDLGHTKLRVGGGKRALIELHDEDSLGALRGRSPSMRRLFAQLKKAARSEVPVLLVGESGTGKELMALALHDQGPRAKEPFVTVDCAALAPNLVASELFGHERGAFTGAGRQHIGAFELAHGGTLFLDEIGELPSELQSHLLGVLERRKFRRVGGQDEITVDLRVLSATNRDLRAEVNAGRFRLDLYYRLAVLSMEVPPLRERIDDLPLLIGHFLDELGHRGSLGEVFSDADLDRLERHHWAGNVRELRNLEDATLAMGETMEPLGDPRSASDGGGRHSPAAANLIECPIGLPYNDARAQLLQEFELRYLTKLIHQAGGNVSKAARQAGMNRSHLFSLLRRHGLR